jgi:uncharacterized protein HemX
MDTNTVVWIVVAVVAIILIGAVVFAGRKSRNRRRAQEADRIREEVHHDTQRVERQATIVEETEAKARAAQAEAEAKAAEAARLADTAASRRDALSSSQEHLDERRQHADKLDPRVKHDDTNGQKDVRDGVGEDTAGQQNYRNADAERMRPDLGTR